MICRVRKKEETREYISNKGTDKPLQTDLSEKKIGNLPNREFKMVINMFTESGGQRRKKVRILTETEKYTQKHAHTHSQKEKKVKKYIYRHSQSSLPQFGTIHCVFRYFTGARYIKLIVEI